MTLTGGKRSTERKACPSATLKKAISYCPMLKQLTERELLYNSGTNMKMSVEHRFKGTDRGMTKYFEKNKVQCHFVHHKSHTEWAGIKRQLPCCWKNAVLPTTP
jgi:hypothetical protein